MWKISDSCVSAYRIKFRFFHIAQRIHGIDLLCLSGIESEDIIRKYADISSTKYIELKLDRGWKPAKAQASCATSHLNRTCSMDSPSFRHNLHRESKCIPLVFNLSATAKAPEVARHKKLRIFGTVGTFQMLRFSSRASGCIDASCNAIASFTLEASSYPLFTV